MSAFSVQVTLIPWLSTLAAVTVSNLEGVVARVFPTILSDSSPVSPALTPATANLYSVNCASPVNYLDVVSEPLTSSVTSKTSPLEYLYTLKPV